MIILPTMKEWETHKTIGIAISAIYRASAAHAVEEMAEYGIKSHHLPYLMLIASLDNPSQEVLARHLMTDKATVARAIKKLVELGLVRRRKNVKDKRVYELQLTEKGKEIRPLFATTMQRWFNYLLEGISDEDVQCLVRTLLTITDKIKKKRA